MGFDDALNNAKNAFSQNEDKIKDFAAQNNDKIDSAVDGASKKAQDLAPDQFDDKIADGAEQAKSALDGWSGQGEK